VSKSSHQTSATKFESGRINFYVNDEDIRFLKGEQTSVKDGDELSIVPAIAGG